MRGRTRTPPTPVCRAAVPDYLMLLGSRDIIPHQQLKNRVTHDALLVPSNFEALWAVAVPGTAGPGRPPRRRAAGAAMSPGATLLRNSR
ncbi:hypothetical protein [Streptomyces sp. XH2]|uniref:hypothetical protein n=1 Tax=Streptomyces sp. XH2 TaxID=3412483 RepID=UPI003C7B36E4